MVSTDVHCFLFFELVANKLKSGLAQAVSRAKENIQMESLRYNLNNI